MLKQVWFAWKAIARKIGDIQSRILLTVFYFLLVAPFAAGVKLLADPLNLGGKGHSNWLSWPARKKGLEEARRQF